MKIGQSNGLYRPYSVYASGKWHTISNIHFYEGDSILVSTGEGWLSSKTNSFSYNKDIESVELPVEEIKTKRKLKFDGTVFIMKVKDPIGYYDTIKTELYIPADMLGIHFVEHKICGNWVYAVYEGEHDIRINHIVKFLDRDMHRIEKEYEELHKKVDRYDMTIRNSEDILANIDRLREIALEYYAERERVRNLTIEDIEL